MKYWLFKTEPNSYSIDDLKKDKTTLWTGIRNYQVRNMLRDDIAKGDKVLIYHSSTDDVGVVGLAEVTKSSLPDPTALDKKDHHYDPKSKKEAPTWFCAEINFIKKFNSIILLHEIKQHNELMEMKLLQKGSRLSVTPVTSKEYNYIIALSK